MSKYINIASQCAGGKDTMADYLIMKYPRLNKGSYADPVKDTFCRMFNVNRDFVEKWKRIPTPPPGFEMPVRQALQFIGDGARKIVPNVWIDYLFNHIKGDSIIADCRYINESRAVKYREGINIFVWRKGYENDDPNLSESTSRPTADWFKDIYESTGAEGYLWNKVAQPEYEFTTTFDLFIANNGTIDQYYDKIDSIVIPFLVEKSFL